MNKAGTVGRHALFAAVLGVGLAMPAAAREVPAWAEAGRLEQARAAAEVVVVIAVDRVTVSGGNCAVAGRIVAVERGAGLELPIDAATRFARVGQAISDHVPCGRRARSSVRRYVDRAALQRSRRARLWYYAGDGALVDYQPL